MFLSKEKIESVGHIVALTLVGLVVATIVTILLVAGLFSLVIGISYFWYNADANLWIEQFIKNIRYFWVLPVAMVITGLYTLIGILKMMIKETRENEKI